MLSPPQSWFRCDQPGTQIALAVEDVTDLQGYVAEIELDETVYDLPDAPPYGIEAGSFLGDGVFFRIEKLEGGRYRVTHAKLGPPGVNGSGSLALLRGTPIAETPVDADARVLSFEARDHLNQPIPLDPVGDSIMRIDCTPPVSALSDAGRTCFRGTAFPDTILARFQAADSGGTGAGLASIVVQWQPDSTMCDSTGIWDTLVELEGSAEFGPVDLPLADPPSEGLWTLYARAIDLAGNRSICGGGLRIRYLPAPPPAVARLRASTGHRSVRLAWDALQLLPGQEVRIVRRSWNDDGSTGYPEYTLGGGLDGGGYPQDLGDGVAIVETHTASEATDSLGAVAAGPDIFLYRAFVVDCADAANGGTAPASITADWTLENTADAADAASNYWLGDIDRDITPPYEQDGSVTSFDLAPLSGGFGLTAGEPGFVPEADFGPSAMPPGSPTGVPNPDRVIDFEDVILLAINYGAVAPREDDPVLLGPTTGGPSMPRLAIRLLPDLAGGIAAEASLLDHVSGVRGIRFVLRYDPGELEMEIARPSDAILARPDAAFAALIDRPGACEFCAITLGAGCGFFGTGPVARFRLQRIGAGEGRISLTGIRIRDLNNEEISSGEEEHGLAGTEAPLEERMRIASLAPNPFSSRLELSITGSRAGESRVRVREISGRMVRELRCRGGDPSACRLDWDGRDSRGRLVPGGAYLIEVIAGPERESRKVLLVR